MKREDMFCYAGVVTVGAVLVLFITCVGHPRVWLLVQFLLVVAAFAFGAHAFILSEREMAKPRDVTCVGPAKSDADYEHLMRVRRGEEKLGEGFDYGPASSDDDEPTYIENVPHDYDNWMQDMP